MENGREKIPNLQKKLHETLLKLLSNIGIIGSILLAIAEVVFVIIFVFGIEINQDMTSIILFAIINAVIGVMISILLRFQGQKYAEIENEDIRIKFYKKRAKEKKHIPLFVYNILNGFLDVVVKGLSAAFSVFGIIYISIKGSDNPIQILISLASLLLFACFGLIAMNASYCHYYDVQVPYMELKIEENKENELN